MWKLLKQCPVFFALLAILLVIGISSCLLTSKLISFIFINFYHDKWLDLFFSYYTFMGDGVMCIVVIITLFLIKKKKTALILLVSYLSSGIFVQLLKRFINNPRPSLYFDQIGFKYPYFVKGIHQMHSGSFPSGHTTSAFAMAIVLTLCFRQKWISLLFMLLAIFAGYSRIYLAQHFLEDVVVGALIGSVFGLISYYYIWQSRDIRFFGIYEAEIIPEKS
ncbi:membrane-associated phospholipid phosphatase [Pedobacter cryoconitis]|uniref:phosphatase PAP2 family protein n=1 Tax=Pedobacter cryoconitis TaxID=188932 RepID=UPI0016138F9D|nr:phosphatase PAP2 family protein [Pedobacter cryoconitis]MBB6271313.1 membrane-associated phospholipid phosphatase [Pedobacter cryoconitis]